MIASKTTSSIAVAVVLALAGPPASAGAKPLKRGAHGTSVKRLQRGLGLPADGVFGPGTARALKRFQRRHLLPEDGIAGPATWDMIRRSRAARRRHSSGHGARVAKAGGAVRVKTRGPSVRLAQRHLHVTADGVYGPGTARVVRRFQRRHGMPADGIVGPATWRALGIRGRHPVLKRARLHGVAGRSHRRSGVPSAIAEAIAAGNRIATLPYVYGGGHGSFSDSGYDCSGSLSYVLHAIGRLGVPRDSTGFMSYGRSGPGRWITIYANPGHAYMTIAGRRFDTSSPGSSRWTHESRSSAGYTVRHPPRL
jgi:peptidoglycan hydrolase-like protein with peptidoglycan-binding domain